MSRKDTIIIALLINAGLLALLFVLAINTDDEKISDQMVMSSQLADSIESSFPPQSPTPVLIAKANTADEVDSFLQGLSSDEMSQPTVIDEEGYTEIEPTSSSTVVAAPSPSPTHFRDDAKYVEVTVKRGDALEKIARNNGTTVEAIKKANQLTSTKLSIGQVLRVPVGKTSSSNSQSSSQVVAAATKKMDVKATSTSEPQYYVIKSGDNPWKIAKQFQIRFEDLLNMNDLDEEKARNLKIGDKIRVK